MVVVSSVVTRIPGFRGGGFGVLGGWVRGGRALGFIFGLGKFDFYYRSTVFKSSHPVDSNRKADDMKIKYTTLYRASIVKVEFI